MKWVFGGGSLCRCEITRVCWPGRKPELWFWCFFLLYGNSSTFTPFPSYPKLQRAALSVQLNIAEGYALRTSKRFRNHLDIAYGSAVETAELLELCGDLDLLSTEILASTLGRCRHCQQLLRGLIKHLA
jgi:four helix bundle protein